MAVDIKQMTNLRLKINQLEREKKIADILKLQLANLERAKSLNADLDKLIEKIKQDK